MLFDKVVYAFNRYVSEVICIKKMKTALRIVS